MSSYDSRGCVFWLVTCKLLAILALAPAAQPADSALPLRAQEIKASRDSLRVTLLNNGRSGVIAFCMTSLHGAVEITEDLPPRPPLLPVGGVRVVSLITEPVPADDLDAEVRSFEVTCVQWEDGTAEGRPEHVASLLRGQSGRAFQLKRLRAIFDRIEQSADADWNAALDGAIQWIASSGRTLDNGVTLPGDCASGMSSENGAARMTLDSLRRLSTDSEGISAARLHLADMISRWQVRSDFLARIKSASACDAQFERHGR